MYILVVLFSKLHMSDRNNCISQLHKLNFSTQHILFIPTRFLRYIALDAELGNRSYMFSFVLLAQETFSYIEKTHCMLEDQVQGTNSQKHKPKF